MADTDPKIPIIKSLDRNLLRKKLSTINWNPSGKVCDVIGTLIEAILPQSRLGMICEVSLGEGTAPILTEVVGFREDKALLLPFSSLSGISPGAIVKRQLMHDTVTVGEHLLGQVVDPFLAPLHQQGLTLESVNSKQMPLERLAPNPMTRKRITNSLSLGVKCIDGLLTVGEGQRIGIFAGSGVGKSVLMGMIARGSSADCNVIGLIGERGREVREFLDKELGEDGLRRSVVVVVTSDQSPLMRLRAAKAVTAIAEYFSSVGKKVLLMMDSLTRVAQAQREIGLAVGEPPTSKGYPPSVFSLLPRILERCGPQPHGYGSISGIYTVLVDGDDFNDPMPDTARAILDGHIHLSRSLAAKGHFPAIDVTTSVSRVMNDVISERHRKMATYLKALISVYQENFDYVQLGTYLPGTNPLLDKALQLMPQIEEFLRQDMNRLSPMEQTINELVRILQTEN